MTREQILARLEQDYARRREDNLRLFEQRREEACGQCRGPSGTAGQAPRRGDGGRALQPDPPPGATHGANAGLAARMAEWNRQIREKLMRGGLAPDFLQPVYTCAVCRDEGYVYDPSRRMCDCMRRELNRRLMEQSGLGAGAATFETYDETVFSDEPDERGRSQRRIMAANRDICRRYADSFPATQVRDLLLMGKSGLGKTFLMQCIARRVAERGHLPTYISAYRFFETARQAYMDNDGAKLAPLMEAELLLIDDLGTEPLMNNVTVTQLFNLLNERQMSGRHTILSTNLSMNELQERYTERVTSRLLDKEPACAWASWAATCAGGAGERGRKREHSDLCVQQKPGRAQGGAVLQGAPHPLSADGPQKAPAGQKGAGGVCRRGRRQGPGGPLRQKGAGAPRGPHVHRQPDSCGADE